MPKMKNPNHEAFALAASSGVSLTDAYEDAGYRGGLADAARLMRRPDVSARVAELRQEQADLDGGRGADVIIALVRMARAAERLGTASALREARLTLMQAERLHRAQSRQRATSRLTVLSDEEWDAAFRATPALSGDRPVAAAPAAQ